MDEDELFFTWHCDGCGLSATFQRGGAGSFMACVDELKHRGWRISRRDGEWDHRCGKCRKTAVAELLDRPLRSVK